MPDIGGADTDRWSVCMGGRVKPGHARIF